MRGKGISEIAKNILNNFYQLVWGSQQGVPVAYLPQSVGPFPCALHRRALVKLADNVDYYCVRDNRSNQLLPGSYRVPDLAVLKVAKEWGEKSVKVGEIHKVLLVVRDLNCPESIMSVYLSKIKRIRAALGEKCELVIQSVGRGNDDMAFAKKVFPEEAGWRTLREAVNDGSKYLVISVRLHGAIESIIAGHPAIHLSYERKGFGAYEDMKIPQYVHNVFEFSVDDVISQSQALLSCDGEYWDAVNSAIPALQDAREGLVNKLRLLVKNDS